MFLLIKIYHNTEIKTIGVWEKIKFNLINIYIYAILLVVGATNPYYYPKIN